jgi:Holliday junction resolvase RusA-like endonuclease
MSENKNIIISANDFNKLKEKGTFNKKGRLVLDNEIHLAEINMPTKFDKKKEVVKNDSSSDGIKIYYFDINPCAKPRMTSSDRWKKRKCTDKYWKFKDELKEIAIKYNITSLPTVIKKLEFGIKMPDSWSQKKKDMMLCKYHTQRPDIDNYIKAYFDSLCDEDSHIAEISNVKKVWAINGYILMSI